MSSTVDASPKMTEALKVINDAYAKLDDDIAAMMPDEVLSALAFIKKHDEPEFSRIYHRMKKYGIAVDMKKRVKIFSKKERFSKKPTYPTPSTLPRVTEDLNLHQPYTSPTLLFKIKPIEADALVICDGETGEVQSVIESVAAMILVECLNGGLAYSNLAKTWHGFDGTHWQPMTSDDAMVDKILIELIYQGTQSIGFKNCYRSNIKSLIADGGFLPLPAVNHNLLPFLNGLLCCQTKTLHITTAGNAQTWCLPYNYTPNAKCPTIQRFLLAAVDGDTETVQFLRAWLAALLHGRADLQIFLHLMGSGGTGKGTFMRLAKALAGEHNATSTTLPAMENNQFETANFYQKRLVMITDSDKYGGSINTLKAMTGQDQLRLERKHQQQSGGFQYEGMVVIASNENLAFTDHTSGLERRRRTVSFDRRVTDAEKQAWNDQGGEAAVLHKEMPGLVNWLLELSQDDISAAIRKPPQRTQDANFEAMQAGNPIAAWLIENCIPDCKEWTQIGECKEIREQGSETKYQDADIHLYPNYLQWAQRYKRVALALVRFRETAIDAVKTFGFDVSAKRRNSGQGIAGIRLKKDWEEPLKHWKPE
ncbi:MAG: phage/plasmid primase, P4 family [Methylobacter sp.]|nr:phage/plasmid primase, P4 family [Methylobacter sp.]